MNNDFIIKDGVLVKYTGSDTIVKIPEEIQIIGDEAFYDNKAIEKIHMSNNIIEIQESAFCNCKNLKEINLSENIETIEKYAISGCDSLKEITIPSKIKANLFLVSNKNLKKIILKESYPLKDINYIIGYGNVNLVEITAPNIICEDGIVYDKNKTELISYLEGKKDKYFKVPPGIKHIYKFAFSENYKLQEIYLNKDLKIIEDKAFNLNTLKKISIPSNIETISKNTIRKFIESKVEIIINGTQEEFNNNKNFNIIKNETNIKFENKKLKLDELIEEGKTFMEASQIIKNQER